MPIAWRLDRIIESCEQNDIGIQLALQHHGQFSTEVNPNWSDNPYNITHSSEGGWLSDPNGFFTDANAIRFTKNKYRYIVARWGYSQAIFAWELFNEVQFVDAWRYRSDKSSVVNWHNTMASYIRSIDPFKHPVTTSSHGSVLKISGFFLISTDPEALLWKRYYSIRSSRPLLVWRTSISR